jgi:4-hydroxy-tetrahydrodipicolinate synthase
MLSGSIVALVTPMDSGGSIDYRDLKGLIDFHVHSGTQALVIAGTTGESATLSRDEHIKLIEEACELANGRIPIIAGTGSNSTAQTLDLSRCVSRLGISAFLIVTPYYNKPTQEGMFRHFSAVADSVPQPVILYNVPARTGVDLKPETTVRLAAHRNIAAVKDATGDLARVELLRERCGSEFALLSGDDASACEFMLRGGDGVVSVTGNVVPAAVRRICDAALAHERSAAQEADAEVQELHRALFVESNPIPVKWAVRQMGLIGPGIRMPLTPLAEEYHEVVRAAMARAGVPAKAA